MINITYIYVKRKIFLFSNENIVDVNIKLSFNHPCKEIVWAPISLPVGSTNPLQPRQSVIPGGGSPNAGFTPSTLDHPNNYRLVLNGADRFTARDITYFTRNQVWDYHTGYGSILFPNSIAVYSFALRPEEHQPSGTCNFSRIDSSLIYFYLRNTSASPGNGDSVPLENYTELPSFTIYAPCYNILRIMGGMGGLAFSN